MIEYENECVGCPPEIGCLGDNCPYSHVKHLYCDECGDEVGTLYDLDNSQYCEKCVLGQLHKHTIF